MINTFMSISQRLIKIVRKGGFIWETDIYAFSNGPRTSNTSYNTVDDSLYMATETPQSRWLVSKTDQGPWSFLLMSFKKTIHNFQMVNVSFFVLCYYFACIIFLCYSKVLGISTEYCKKFTKNIKKKTNVKESKIKIIGIFKMSPIKNLKILCSMQPT